MTLPANPAVCYKCKHLYRDSACPPKCEAFPKGIPDKILDGFNDHSKPFKGDNGIRFEYGEPQLITGMEFK